MQSTTFYLKSNKLLDSNVFFFFTAFKTCYTNKMQGKSTNLFSFHLTLFTYFKKKLNVSL